MQQFLREQREFRNRMIRFVRLGFVALAGVILSAGVLMAMNQRQVLWVSHTYQTARQIAATRVAVMRLETAWLRDKALSPKVRSEALAKYRGQLMRAIDGFDRQTSDNPRQQARLPLLRVIAQQVGGATGLNAADRLEQPMSVFDQLADAMQAEESRLLDLRNEQLRTINQGFYIALGITALLLVVVGSLSYSAARAFTQEIIASRQALREGNAGLEAAVQERTVHLKRANGELQRFAYIVSHDLRSPLVNVMGFTAELEASNATLMESLQKFKTERPGLVRPHIAELIEVELPESIHFIRASTQKMDRLINAILHLSRQGNRAMVAKWLDMNAVVADIVATLNIRIAEARAQVRIASKLPEIYCDRVAIEQILSNLIENAIKYSHPERDPEVTITGRRDGDMCELCVADNGRGIESRDFARVFDLFRRAGAQDKPGEGIGLAHVRALVYRLGGTVTLESKINLGSSFTISLPVHYSEELSQIS